MALTVPLCILGLSLLAATVSSWMPTGIGMLPADVVRPALTFGKVTANDKDSSPFHPTSFGLPLVALGANLRGPSAQFVYPLQETLQTGTAPLTMPDVLGSSISGSSVVSLSNGTVLFLSMCSVHPFAGAEGAGSSVAVFSGANLTELVPLWSSPSTLVNASCAAVWLPLLDANQTSLQEREVVLIVGGWSSEINTSGTLLSVWDPSTLEWHSIAAVPPLTRGSLLHPMVTFTSNKVAVVGGGVLVHNFTNWTNAAVSTTVMGLAVTLRQNRDVNSSVGSLAVSVEVLMMPELPSALFSLVDVAQCANSFAMTVFEDSLYVGVVTYNNPGIVGRLELSQLESRKTNNEWLIEILDGDNFQLLGASTMFLALPHEGTVLALFAVGGLAPAGSKAPSISYVVVDASFVPAWVVVPYNPIGTLTSVVGSQSVNISVTFELIAAGASGLLALGSDAACSTVIGDVANYQGTSSASLTGSFSAETCTSQNLWSRPLYLCFSNNVTVLWKWGNGNVTTTLLFSAISPLEPLLFPSLPPTTAPTSTNVWEEIRDFVENHWLYVVMGALGLVTIVAVLVSVKILRRKGLRRGLSQIFHERSPLLPDDDDDGYPNERHIGRYDPLKIATNSHSSRYTTISPLTSLDGGESDVSFLVQRKNDRSMLVMKYIACEGDIERLLSIREFEALNILQGHPNVVQYVDMFMNYAFSLHRLGRSHDTRGMVGDVVEPTDLSLNTTQAYVPLPSVLTSEPDVSTPGSLPAPVTPSSSLLSPKIQSQRVSRLSLPPAEPTSARDSVVNNRYVCLVMEYMPQGNIATWLMKQSEQQLPFSKRARRSVVPPQDLPPASEQLILSIALQVNGLLKYMHYDSEVTLAHKGLKPENILVSGPVNTTGTFVPIAVADFGFSVLGNFTPPSRMAQRRRDSNDLDRGSDGGSRSSMSQPMDTSGYLQSPKCDMWCFGCVLFSLCTFRFGERFPYLADLISTRSDGGVYVSIQNEMKSRGYSRELVSLTISLLHLDEKLRPSSESVSRLFARLPDGTLSLSVPSVKNRREH